jgi:plastocyanin
VRRAPFAAAAVVLVLGGCGEDRYGSSSTSGGTTLAQPAPPKGPTGSVKVTEVDFRLKPASIRVDRPATVTIHLRNRGKTDHALAVEGPHGETETAPIGPRESATMTVKLDKAGTYEWYCPVDDHKGKGMKGQIVVGKGAAEKGDKGGGSKPGEDDGGSGVY